MLGPGESRVVLLPAGAWTDFWTAKTYTGPKRIRIAMPLDRIGVFLRDSACVPLELAPSLVPGESMSAGRTKAILTTGLAANAQLSAQSYGASHLLVYGGGNKRTIAVSNASF
jgi:alpha-glucosidase (family GH31 glycosyl hydrolase)